MMGAVKKTVLSIGGLFACAAVGSLRGDILTDNLLISQNGYDVTGYQSTGSGPIQLFWSFAQVGTYTQWSHSWQLPERYGTISFDAVATNDVTVGITRIDPWLAATTDGVGLYGDMINWDNFYEIVIGGWGNGNSAIRKGAQANPLTFVDRGIPLQNVPTSFKVIFYYDTQHEKDTVAVYVFNILTQKWNKIMSNNDHHFAEGPRWISFSSWDSFVFFENISVTSDAILPEDPILPIVGQA